ncbi:MAG: CHASE2 domain-containing protein [Geitlerinemataceae cyanobacterium]
MSTLVLLNFIGGSLATGFPVVTAQITIEGDDRSMQFRGSLPPAPEIGERYKRWQLLYTALYDRGIRSITFPAFEIASDDITNVSEVDFEETHQQLKDRINLWLNSPSFAELERKLRTVLNPQDEIRVILETDDDRLDRLPWHLWNFFEDYPQAEMALGCWESGRVYPSNRSSQRVRILAIFGNSEGIDTTTDRRLLETLSDVELVVLESPHRQALNETLWDDRGWDILFFAGHSQTEGETGKIYINDTESLTISQLKYALKTAIARGLQFAIFNSCDGLGLAKQLADLQIPQTIVMREPVADRVAQAFLAYFLTAFSGGKSFYLAVREARERLQGLEGDFPGASWLPVICQNPAQIPISWEMFRQQPEVPIAPRRGWQAVLVASSIAAALVMGVRSTGWLQIGEWQAYDFLMRMRPAEELDDRLLVVEATEEDIGKYGFPVPDGILAQAIETLERHQPRTIGVDIYRDRPVGEGGDRLLRQFQQNPRLVAVCSDKIVHNPNKPGIAPPPGVAESRLGFSDVVKDADGAIRRHLMFMQPHHTSPCIADFALSTRLALNYLAADSIVPQTLPPKQIKIGDVVFNPLKTRSGGYQNLDDRGFQMMLNYRASAEVSRRVGLSQLLSGEINPDWVKNKIVLIGVTSPISTDEFYTPYSAAALPYQTMPGVILQAHMTSQIISAVKDGRSLIWGLPGWGDFLWVWGWATLGSWAIRGDKIWRSIGFLGGTIVLLGGLSWGLFILGIWLPIAPCIIALFCTVGGLRIDTFIRIDRLGDRRKKVIFL